jgi:diadenosine tetraphosphate (Ap4A) HIT family hydrolase
MCNFYESLDFSRIENHIFCETKNFIVIPSIGSLIEGWLMIVSKLSYGNSLQFPINIFKEYLSLLTDVRCKIEKVYGTWSIFENGASKNAAIGCGVHHAHTHIVPLPFNIHNKIEENIGSYFEDGNSESSFIYAENSFNKKYYFVNNKESQFIRKLIANELNIPDLFDYKQYPMLQNISSTIKNMHVVF